MNSTARIPASLGFSVILGAGTAARAQVCNHHWDLIPPPQGAVGAVTPIDLGAGPELYGHTQYFPLGSGITAPTIVRWNGSAWDDVAPVGGYISVFEKFDDGTGPMMFVGGEFVSVGGVTSRSIARWGGASWFPVPTGWTSNAIVLRMTVYDDGTGPALVVGGWFPGGVAGIPSSHIAKWNGMRWSGFGSGLTGGNGGVGDIEVFDDDGPGPNPPALYVGGWFEWAGGTLARRIARWDGRQWHALGAGIQPGVENGPVRTLTVYYDGSGPTLYVGGVFISAGNVPNTQALARWDGSSWSSVAHPIALQGSSLPGVTSLFAFDDGVRGPGLIAGGQFTTIGGVNAKNLARYDRSGWSHLGAEPESWFIYMARFDECPTPTLWVNASFEVSPGVYGTGRYQYVCEPCYPDCDGSGTLTVKDFTCFQTKFVAADPEADCNQSGTLTVADFTCFQTRFVAGCP